MAGRRNHIPGLPYSWHIPGGPVGRLKPSLQTFPREFSAVTESPNPTILRVLPTPFARWRVEMSTSDQPFQFVTKGQAISFAVAWADLHQPSEVEVYGFAGRVERHIQLPNGHRCRGHGLDRRRMRIDIPFTDRRKRERRIYV